MKKSSQPQPLRPYAVIVADPDAEWRLAHVKVDAISPDEAKRAARVALAATKQDHWSITMVEPMGVAS